MHVKNLLSLKDKVILITAELDYMAAVCSKP
jgi:hypothetical protein